MKFNDKYRKIQKVFLSDIERRDSRVLLVDPDNNVRFQLRQTLGQLGFTAISEAHDQAVAISKCGERKPTHLIFDARKTKTFDPREFLKKAMELDPSIVAIAASSEPTIDDVFGLLVLGARGFLVKPFNQISLEASIVEATKGDKMSDAVLGAVSRNAALTAIVLGALDRLSTVLRQAEAFDTAKAEVPMRLMAFKRSVEVSHVFAEGGLEALTDTMVEQCLVRANGSASRLGRARRRAAPLKSRIKDAPEQAPPAQGAE